MKLKLKEIDKQWKVYALAGSVCMVVLVCLLNLGKILGAVGIFLNILKPVFIGFVMAYILNPMVMFFNDKVFKAISKEKLKWSLSVIVTVIIVLCIIILLVAMLVPQIMDNVVSLTGNYSGYVLKLTEFLDGLSEKFGHPAIIDNIKSYLALDSAFVNKLGKIITSNAAVIIKQTTTIGAATASWFIGFIFAVYFLVAKAGIKAELNKVCALMLSPLKYERLLIISTKFHSIFSKFIVMELLDALIVGIANYIFMVICGMPDAIFISFIVGATNLIPTFGPLIGLVAGVIILLLLQPSSVLAFIIFTAVLQTLDGYVIKPKIFGNALNVPGVLILAAIILFGKLMGVGGMLLAIPISAIIMYFYTEVFIPWLELKKDLRDFKKDQA